ncbi:NAD(P)-dependent oxidoreductase [Opitutus sp. GAS368]|uniref:NAD(P)-dependent oxidoreductase n=1 Tax=Opitutus sp. GAS368 TaxID=1882749 RepID=UPI00087DCF61|nr:NAD(P)-dependent oxidoreductase [Opitutus sp. GAS368]SDS17578.1 3-hydroxyisobutyrate dehydrogenase/glyoxylate/succinic semialdehyde reductase [Opitutus sp. GAS368]
MKIGFIGLGIMGSRMAANLQKGGHTLIVHNRTRDKAEPLLFKGAAWAGSPAAVAAQAEIVFTMLAPTQAVTNAALGPDGLLSTLEPGRLWVDCSTVNPSFSREMAEHARTHGLRFLDAPVTGSRSQAEQAALLFLVGGAGDDLAACRPLLELMGTRITHCGGPGMGASLKIVINQLLGTGMAAFAEALVLGESLGLARAALFEALLGGPVTAPFLQFKRERIEQGNYEPADFPLRWLQKDLHLAAVSAHESGAAMPLLNAAKELNRLAIRDGHGDEDFAAIYSYLAGHREVR